MDTPTGSAQEKFCFNCGAKIDSRAEICPKCGLRQPNQTEVNPNAKSRIAAGLFAFFLGGFGIHKFYLGRPGQGILYLLFFWTFIPGIIALIEAIIYFTMTDKAFAAKYNR